MHDAVLSGLDNKLIDVREQLDQALADKEAGQARVDEEEASLDALEEDLVRVDESSTT